MKNFCIVTYDNIDCRFILLHMESSGRNAILVAKAFAKTLIKHIQSLKSIAIYDLRNEKITSVFDRNGKSNNPELISQYDNFSGINNKTEDQIYD